ncbi:MAG TPA: xanthine dehydrogenase family protein molybdopterin-binding subunit [Bacteroidota bacterium]|nr:xanthine dehydrogenase family protein molybdopterin-binding subunit [Bacteroidota bacterium]
MKTQLNRREFIRVSAGAGGGLVLGVMLPAFDSYGQQLERKPDEFVPNVWLRIAKDGTVTILVARSEMGQGVRTALPMIVAEELDADWSKVRIEQAVAKADYGSMGTGGSTSVRTSWDRLRKAGASARMMLLQAAAGVWGVRETECRTEAGTVIHNPTGRLLPYGDLVEAASKLKAPENPPLKDPKDFKIIGRKIARTDTPEKVDGSAVFGIDVKVPGLLHAAVARCPVFGGKVARYDDSKARGITGVKQVAQIDSGVAVIANSTWSAFQGRDALAVTFDEGPAASLSSEKIEIMLREHAAKRAAVAEKAGDVTAAMASAAKKVSASFDAPFLAHATMEPMNTTAWVQKDRCEIWAPTQDPQGYRREAARLCALPEEKVIVHTTYLGGGFGRRWEADVLVEAVQCSKATGVPVRVTWTREDDMRHDFYRPVSHHVLSGGLSAERRLVAFAHRVVAPSITGQSSPERIKDGLDKSAVEGTINLPYEIPNLQIEYVMANTPVPIGSWRSVYPSQNVFALECFMDELAGAAGKDPFEFRRALMLNRPKMLRVLDLAAEKSGWGKPLPAGRYRGIAFSPPSFFRTPVAQVAEISVENRTVRVHRVVCAIDCGIVINPDGLAVQMEGGVVYGLSAALKGEITLKQGRVEQGNFDDYPILTLEETPVVETYSVQSNEAPTGTGEPGLPAIAPAVANAVFAATGKRIRRLPIRLG